MIHPSAIIEDGAKIGNNTSIGAFSYIGSNVVLGDNINIYIAREDEREAFNIKNRIKKLFFIQILLSYNTLYFLYIN